MLSLRGELDIETARGLRAQLREVVEARAGAGTVVVDGTGLTFIDSTGLGVLIGARRAAVEAGATFAVRPSRRLLALVERTGLGDYLGVNAA